MKEKLIIIGSNDFQNQLILKAKQKGFETHVFSWRDGSVGEKTADKFYPISITEKEKILEKAKEINAKGVVSIASDLAVITVNFLANHLGLVGNSDESTKVSTNKYEMRERFLQKNIPSPKFFIVGEGLKEKDFDLQYPLIVKPTDRSGSRGITKVSKKEDLSIAIETALKVSFEKKVLIEEFVEGNEYSAEIISYNGEHHFLALTEKFTTGSPNFIETAHIQSEDLFDEQSREHIITIIKQALDSLDIKNGASHSEFKIDKYGNIKIIEIGARMGGDCIGSDLVKISTGYDFVDMVIDVACGKKPNFIKVNEPKVAAIKFIFSEEDLKILELIKAKHNDKIYRISEIEEVGSRIVSDSSTRYGYYILNFDSYKEAKEILNLRKTE